MYKDCRWLCKILFINLAGATSVCFNKTFTYLICQFLPEDNYVDAVVFIKSNSVMTPKSHQILDTSMIHSIKKIKRQTQKILLRCTHVQKMSTYYKNDLTQNIYEIELQIVCTRFCMVNWSINRLFSLSPFICALVTQKCAVSASFYGKIAVHCW